MNADQRRHYERIAIASTMFGCISSQLIEMRMEQAAKLLCVLPLLSIKEIADRTGYSNSMNFSTAFRRWYGMSPRQYRKQTFNGTC